MIFTIKKKQYRIGVRSMKNKPQLRVQMNLDPEDPKNPFWGEIDWCVERNCCTREQVMNAALAMGTASLSKPDVMIYAYVAWETRRTELVPWSHEKFDAKWNNSMPLCFATAVDDRDTIMRLVALGANPNADSARALLTALWNQRLIAAQALLDCGASFARLQSSDLSRLVFNARYHAMKFVVDKLTPEVVASGQVTAEEYFRAHALAQEVGGISQDLYNIFRSKLVLHFKKVTGVSISKVPEIRTAAPTVILERMRSAMLARELTGKGA